MMGKSIGQKPLEELKWYTKNFLYYPKGCMNGREEEHKLDRKKLK